MRPFLQKYNSKGYNYGFVEFDDPGAAERAMQTLNGRRIHQSVCQADLPSVFYYPLPPQKKYNRADNCRRKFASTGLTSPTAPTRRIPRTISTSSWEI